MFGELRPVDGGMPILLDKPSLTVGQDRTSDVVIEHPSVSASHCHMEFREGHWFIEDLGSRDGIRVNGEKVESAWVPALSVINIGAIEFDLQYSSQGPESDRHGSVSAAQLSKLDRVLKSVQSFKTLRIQIQADQSLPANVSKTLLGSLQPINGGDSIPLLYDELYLGRDPDSDVILPYMSVAKTHCVLRFQEGYWLVRDLNSNGVTIDGKTTQEGWLLPGTVLGLATHQFEMAYSTTATSPPPEMAVPINEFDVSDDDLEPVADSDVFDVDESALIDSDDEIDAYDPALVERDHQPDASNAQPVSDAARVSEPLAASPSLPPVRDQPLLAVAEMLQSVESVVPSIEHSEETVSSEPKPLAPATTTTSNAKPRATARSIPSKSLPAKKTRRSKRERQPTTPKATAPSVPQPPSTTPPETTTTPRSDFASLRRNQILQFLKDRNFDALLLTQPSNIAWYTGGTNAPRGLFGQITAALLLTPDSATLLARRSDVDVMLGSESSLAGLQHRVCEWPEDSQNFLKDWSQPKRLACDRPLDFCDDVSSEIAAMRLPLSSLEIETLRKLGIRVTRAIEKAARELRRGDTEAQIAGDVASRLVRHEVVPERIQVWGDGRGQTCPNWTFRRDAVEHFCTISVVARRQGLHIAVSRTVSFGTPPKDLRWTHSDMLWTHAAAMQATRDQTDVSTVLTRVKNACEKLGFAPDWQTTLPGCVTGYELCEAPISSQSSLRLRSGMPLIWQSSIGPARAVDTLLVRKADCKVITQTGEWPQSSMTINGERFHGQAVLQRDT